jgi:hypothetical protein
VGWSAQRKGGWLEQVERNARDGPTGRLRVFLFHQFLQRFLFLFGQKRKLDPKSNALLI